MERWFFSSEPDAIYLRARGEGVGGLIGDFQMKIGPGEKLGDLSYDDLERAGAGVVRHEAEGVWIIETGRAQT
jgi:hypothetical protein